MTGSGDPDDNRPVWLTHGLLFGIGARYHDESRRMFAGFLRFLFGELRISDVR